MLAAVASNAAFAGEVQVGLLLLVEEHGHELDPPGARKRARIRRRVEHDILVNLSGVPRVREHHLHVLVRGGARGPVGVDRIDLLGLLQLLQARRVHVLRVHELDRVAQVEHLHERHRRRAGQPDARDGDGKVLGVLGEGRAVGVSRGRGRTAQSQHVRAGNAGAKRVRAAVRAHNLEVRVVMHGKVAGDGHVAGAVRGIVRRDAVRRGEVLDGRIQGGAAGARRARGRDRGRDQQGLRGEAFGDTRQSRRRLRVAKRRLPRATRGGEGFQSARVRGKPRARDARTARTLMIFIVFEF